MTPLKFNNFYGLYQKADFDPSIHKFYPNQSELQV